MKYLNIPRLCSVLKDDWKGTCWNKPFAKNMLTLVHIARNDKNVNKIIIKNLFQKSFLCDTRDIDSKNELFDSKDMLHMRRSYH